MNASKRMASVKNIFTKNILIVSFCAALILVHGMYSTAASAAEATTTPPGYIMPTGGGNAASSGSNAATTQLVTAAVNVGASQMYASVCATRHGQWACPLASIAGVAAGILASASGGSGRAASAMSAFDAGANGNALGADGKPMSTISLPDGTNAQTIANALTKIKKDLAAEGANVSADGKTMTTKDGRTFDLSKAGDGSQPSLMAMGLTADEANQATDAGKKYAAKANAKFAAMAGKIADGGGGGGGARGTAADAVDYGGATYGLREPRERQKIGVSGLTKKLGDDTIGVSGDNIFEMVTRRYKARDQVNGFLKD